MTEVHPHFSEASTVYHPQFIDATYIHTYIHAQLFDVGKAGEHD